MSRFEENDIMPDEVYQFDMPASDDFNYTKLTLHKIDDDEYDDEDNDDNFEDEEEEDNPFDKEPSENDIIEDDIPLIDPEDELLDDDDDDDDFQYN